MQWVWVEMDDFGWFGLALKWPDKEIFAFPTRMIAQRLCYRANIRIYALVTNVATDTKALAAGSHPGVSSP